MKESELPEKIKSLWLKSLSAFELKNYEYAVSLLTPVVKEVPEFLNGRKMLRKSEIEHKKGKKKLFSFSKSGFSNIKAKGLVGKDPKEAMKLLEDNLVQEPYDIDTNYLLYDCAMALNMTDTASFALETIKEGHPKNTKAMHKLAEHYVALEEPKKASEIYYAILAVDKNDLIASKGAKDAEARASIKKNKMESGNYRDWIKDKDVTEKLEAEGRAGMTKDQMEQKLASMNSEFENDSNNYDLTMKIATLCEELEDYENATNFYKWAYELSSNDSSLEQKISEAERKYEDKRLAELKAEIDSYEDQNSPEIQSKIEEYDNLCLEQAKKRLDVAIQRAQKNPTDPQIRFELGLAFYEAKDYTKAIPELQKCKNNPHLHIKVMLLLGQCYSNKNMLDLAKNILEEAKSELQNMDNTKKQVVYELGLTYEKMNNLEESLNAMKEIYQVDYQYRDVSTRVEQSYQK